MDLPRRNGGVFLLAPFAELTFQLVVACNRAASAHLWQNLLLDHRCCLAGLGSFIKSSKQAHETENPLVVVCCFVVSTKCANRFSIYCIDSLFNCSGLHFGLRPDGARRCWLPVLGDIDFVFWTSLYHSSLPFMSHHWSLGGFVREGSGD